MLRKTLTILSLLGLLLSVGLATALLDIEPRLRKVCGCKQLIRLRTALQTGAQI